MKNNSKRRSNLIFIGLCFATWAVLNTICYALGEFSLVRMVGTFVAVAIYCYYVIKQTNPFIGVVEDREKEEE